MCDQLYSHGVRNNKSLVLRSAILPEGLIPHYIRGIFDGDGYIGINDKRGNSSLTISIAGTRWINEWIAGHFREIYPNEISPRTSPSGNYTRLCYSGFAAEKLCKWMYKNASVYMGRKYSIAAPFCANHYIIKREQPWLLSEEYLLTEHLDSPLNTLVELLPGKTKKAIINKRCRLLKAA
jgi:hypothetical protein